MRAQVEAYMREHQMLDGADCVIAGVSGGADSVCLLWILKELEKRWGFSLTAVHVHHGIRGEEADEDEAYVQSLCRQWGISCRCIHVDVPHLARQENMTLEEAGRKARYDAFEAAEAQSGSARIAVAHHRDDNIETILMNLFRGSGLKGISGMEPMRGNVIRPLLCVRRSQIEAFLRQEGIAWRTDSTNLQTEYTRNKIRHTFLPMLEEAFPSAGEHLLRTAQLAGEAGRWIAGEACTFLEKNSAPCESGIQIDRAALQEQHPALQKEIVRQALVKSGVGLKDISGRHIEEICLLAGKGVGKSVSLPGKCEAKNGYETMRLGIRQEKRSAKCESFRMEVRQFPYKKTVKFPENRYTKWFDYDTITDTIVLRTRKTGDRIQVHPNGSKKLKDYMIDVKIPREQRDQIPIVAAGNQVLWVVGYRISEAFQVKSGTKQIIQITLISENQEEKGGLNDGRSDPCAGIGGGSGSQGEGAG